MNPTHVQTFLMVSAAFFAMSAPLRSGSGATLANAVARTARVAPSRMFAERLTPPTPADDDAGRNS